MAQADVGGGGARAFTHISAVADVIAPFFRHLHPPRPPYVAGRNGVGAGAEPGHGIILLLPPISGGQGLTFAQPSAAPAKLAAGPLDLHMN